MARHTKVFRLVASTRTGPGRLVRGFQMNTRGILPLMRECFAGPGRPAWLDGLGTGVFGQARTYMYVARLGAGKWGCDAVVR